MLKSKIQKILMSLMVFSFVFNLSWSLAFAAGDPIKDSPANDPGFQIVPPCNNGGNFGPTQNGGNLASGECGWNDLIQLANNVVTFLVWLSASLAVIAFCYAGFLYITAFGESGKIEQAHGIFKAALTGMFFVLCGWLIIATILKTLIGGDSKNDTANINSIVPFKDVKTIQGQGQ